MTPPVTGMGPYKRWSTAVAPVLALLFMCTVATAVNTESLGGAADFRAAAALEPVFRCGYDPAEVENTAWRARNGTERHTEDVSLLQSTSFKPIRIKLFFFDLDNSSQYCSQAGQLRPNFRGGRVWCRNEDVLTEVKKKIVRSQMAPAARKLHEERLNVQRLNHNILLSEMRTTGLCPLFSIPERHKKNGVARADFVLYVASGADEFRSAWAATCAYLESGRPTVGVSHISTWFLKEDPKMERIMAHEVLHAMGFNAYHFTRKDILRTVNNLREKPGSLPVLMSKKVVAATRAHFNCSTLSYLELEDTGNAGTPSSHWKMRSMWFDLMAPTGNPTYYSAMTMAVMEDIGYYTVNYEKAEILPWGRNAGCNFFYEKCVKDGKTNYPSMFCTSAMPYPTCTIDRRGAGYCTVNERRDALPSYFQYFSNPNIHGSGVSFVDYCPIIQDSKERECTFGDATNMPGSVIQREARCFDITPQEVAHAGTTTRIGAICAEVQCGVCGYSVRVKGATEFRSCTPGLKISLPFLSSEFKEGTLTCPPFNEVCTDYINPLSAEGPYSSFCESEPVEATVNITIPPALALNLSDGICSTFPALLAVVFGLLY